MLRLLTVQITVAATLALASAHAEASQQSPGEKQSDPLCIRSAAAYHRVNEDVLKAIIWGESRMNAKATNLNANGSMDLGASQINTIHLPRLRRYGITEDRLLDGCTSVYVGAWILSELMADLGNTWAAVGAYHSRTQKYQEAYANSVAITLAKWGKLRPGWLPYPYAAKSSAEVQRMARGDAPSSTGFRPGLKETLAQSAIAAISD